MNHTNEYHKHRHRSLFEQRRAKTIRKTIKKYMDKAKSLPKGHLTRKVMIDSAKFELEQLKNAELMVKWEHDAYLQKGLEKVKRGLNTLSALAPKKRATVTAKKSVKTLAERLKSLQVRAATLTMRAPP